MVMASTRFSFGATQPKITVSDEGMRIDLPIPLLRGNRIASILNHAQPVDIRHLDQGAIMRDSGFISGALFIPDPYPLPEITRQIYETLIRSTQGYAFARIWNYVPHINNHVGDLEAYRAFCKGRSEAFANHQLPMPAASAVGIQYPALIVAFVATRHPVHHIENPEQVPAYCYPQTYGPRPPSFSRASLTNPGIGRRQAFVSGTAAIKGHASVFPDSLRDQVEVTLDNLRIMGREIAKVREEALNGNHPFLTDTTLYLRNPDHLPELLAILESRNLLTKNHRIVQADICRSELLIEIETQDNGDSPPGQ